MIDKFLNVNLVKITHILIHLLNVIHVWVEWINAFSVLWLMVNLIVIIVSCLQNYSKENVSNVMLFKAVKFVNKIINLDALFANKVLIYKMVNVAHQTLVHLH